MPPLIDFVCNDSALPFGPLLLWFAIKSSSAEKLCPANFVICSCWGHRVFPQMVHSTRLLITPTLSNPSFEQHPVLKNSTVGLHCLFFTVLLASTQKSSGNWTSACPPGTRRQMEDLHDDFSVHFPLPATCPLWPLATFLEQSKTLFWQYFLARIWNGIWLCKVGQKQAMFRPWLCVIYPDFPLDLIRFFQGPIFF